MQDPGDPRLRSARLTNRGLTDPVLPERHVAGFLGKSYFIAMADMNEPKKETVPNTPPRRRPPTIPPAPLAQAPTPAIPTPEVAIPPSPAPPKPVPQRPAPLAPSLGATPASRPAHAGSGKETARIADSAMKATVRLGAIQAPTAPARAGIRATAPPAVEVATPALAGLADSVPIALCWGLLSVSALLLLIQLWSYFS